MRACPSPRDMKGPCGSGAAANAAAVFTAPPVAAEAAPTASLRDLQGKAAPIVGFHVSV